jgi:CheY-like chemotaxis protein
VTATTSSVEAMELLRARPESFDLLLTDLTMPGLTGADLTREALEVRPRLAVLVMTGEGMGFDEEGARRLGARAFVAKPLTLAGLAEAVRRALAPPVDRVA